MNNSSTKMSFIYNQQKNCIRRVKVLETLSFLVIMRSIGKTGYSQDVMLTKSDLLIPEALSERIVMSLWPVFLALNDEMSLMLSN